MKKKTGIWMDSSKAVVVSLSLDKHVAYTIESNVENRIYHEGEGDKGSRSGDHHIDHEKKFDERRKNQLQHFFSEVLSKVSDAEELYVFGPGNAKVEFEKKIKKHNALAGKLTKVEVSDSMTENQVVAKVREFFGQ